MPILPSIYSGSRTKPKNTHDPFYDTRRWRRLSAAQRKKEPTCRECKKRGVITAGTLADHIIPRHVGGAEWDEDNLQTLCDICHQIKRAGEKQKRGR